MADTSALQTKLIALLADTLPILDGTDYTWGFDRTRTQNEHDAKWIVTIQLSTRKKPTLIKSLVPARDLVKTRSKLVILSETTAEVWVGMQPNVDGILAQLRSSPLWVPRVQKAIEKTLSEQQANPT
jgi:hypothetical protein